MQVRSRGRDERRPYVGRRFRVYQTCALTRFEIIAAARPATLRLSPKIFAVPARPYNGLPAAVGSAIREL